MTDANKAPRDLGKAAFMLWAVSAGIPVLAFLIGVLLWIGGGSVVAEGSTSLILPAYAAVIWAPVAIVALFMGVVAVRDPGSSKDLAIATVSLTGIGVFPFVIALLFAGLTLLRL